MRRLSLDAIVTVAMDLTSHGAAYPSRIVYLCAHVLPTMDAEKAPPFHSPLKVWDAYLDSYGIRPTEKRWVIRGFQVYEQKDLQPHYEHEHMNHLMWSLKNVGAHITQAEADYQSDYHPGEKAPADAPDSNADTHEKPQ